MHDAYYWHDKTPTLDYTTYHSQKALLKDLIYSPTDRWSFITSLKEFNDYYSSGEFVGVGISMAVDYGNFIMIRYVIPGSPADRAGLKRGDSITAISDIPVSSILDADDLDDAMKDDDVGVVVKLNLSTGRRVTLTKEVVSVTSVVYSQKTLHNGNMVGYFMLDRFILPTEDELTILMDDFIDSNVTELIIDLRYNGGGTTDVSKTLANYLLPSVFDGSVYTRYIHNSNYSSLNQEDYFISANKSLSLNRVFIITSNETASASEQLINGLLPYTKVITIGDYTNGKPYGMYANEFCDEVLVPIQFKMQNANGDSWLTSGIPPTCTISESSFEMFGSTTEPLYKAALDYIDNGSCPANLSAANKSRPFVKTQKSARPGGFRGELGLY